jgi:hypothetical protein
MGYRGRNLGVTAEDSLIPEASLLLEASPPHDLACHSALPVSLSAGRSHAGVVKPKIGSRKIIIMIK